MRDLVLITGGAGFIGSNLADALLRDGQRVAIVDNLARAGVEANVRWLEDRHGTRVSFLEADVRDPASYAEALAEAREVFHFAAQVAVTTSVDAPQADFDVNARGTLALLEAVRAQSDPPSVVFTSTNKVYGALDDAPLRADDTRYEPEDRLLAEFGIGPRRPLDFHSPYGCSKGAADQYVLDYARTYGLRTVVFRMSCIYGPRQLGTEDQGWVAHFLRRALDGLPITIYGDGRQVRDVLFVDDLVEALRLASVEAGFLAGRAFNIGGGPRRTLSLIETLDRITALTGRRPDVTFAGWRIGDQRWYVSDTRAFEIATGWSPRVTADEGLARLHEWLVDERAAQGAQRRSA